MADLGISISLDSAQYTRGLAQVQQQTNAATASVSKGLNQIGTTSQQSGAAVSAFTQNLGGLGSVLSGGLGTVALAGAAGAAVLKFGEALFEVSKESIEISSKVQSVNRALAFTAGSAESGAAAYSRFKDTANELGISIEKNQIAYKNFIVSATQSGQTMQAAEKEFKQVAIAMTAMGLSAEDSNGVLLALGQIASKGTVSAEELRGQIGERLPGAFAIAARSIGVTESKLNDMLKQGEVVSKDFLPKFTNELEKTFGATAQQGVNSYASQLNLLNNQILELKTSFGEELLPVVTDFFKEVASGIKTLRELGFTGKDAVNGLVEGLKLAVGPLAKVISALSTAKDLLNSIGVNTNISLNKKAEGVGSTLEGVFGFLGGKGFDDAKLKIQFYKDAIAQLKAQAKGQGAFELIGTASRIKEYESLLFTLQNQTKSTATAVEDLNKSSKKLAKEGIKDVKKEVEKIDPATGSLSQLRSQLSKIQTQINESPNDLNLLTALQSQAVATTASIKDVENQIAKAKRIAEGFVFPNITGISNLPSQGQIAPAENILIAPQVDTSQLDKLIGKLNEVDTSLLGTQRKVEEAFKQFKESQINALGDAVFNLGAAFGNVASGSQTAGDAFSQFAKDTLTAVLVSAPRLLGLDLLKTALTALPPLDLGMMLAGVALLGISGLAGGLISQIGQQPESIASQAATGTGLTGAAITQATAQGLGAANNAPQTITQVTVVLETNGIIREIQKQEYINGELKGL